MKASKAAQNSSRIASRSIRISWRAPGSTIACPALRRAANALDRRRRADRIGAGGDDQGRRADLERKARIGELRMKRKAASSHAMVGLADGAGAAAAAVCGVAGVADAGRCVSAVAGEGLASAIEVAPPPGTKRPPRPSEAQQPRQRGRGFGDLTMQSAIIGAVATRRAKGSRPARAAPARSRRPSNGRARNAASAYRASTSGP